MKHSIRQPELLCILLGLCVATACSDSEDNPVDPATGGAGAGAGSPTGPGSGSGGADGSCREVVDSVPVGTGDAFTPDILATSDGWAVVSVNAGEIWLDMLDDMAAGLSRAQLSQSAGTALLPSIEPLEDGFVVVWMQGSDIYVRMVSATGTPGQGPALVAETTSAEPRPDGATTGDGLAACWMQSPTSSRAAVLSGAAIEESEELDGLFPAVAARDGEIGVAWSTGGEGGPVSFARLGDPTATVIDGSASLIKDMVAGDEGFYVAWEDVTAAYEQVKLARIAGTSVETRRIGPDGWSANWPSLAWLGEDLAIAYYQFRDGPAGVYLAIVGSDLTDSGLDLEISPAARFPAVAGGHGSVAVAYNLDPGPVEVSIVTCQ